MLNIQHLAREAICPGCGVTWTFQGDESEIICKYCKNTVKRPSENINTEEVESLLLEGDRLCNALEFREAWYYYRRAKDLDPKCVKAYWGLIRAKYGIQIVYEDKTQTKFQLSAIRIPEEIDHCEEWHALKNAAQQNYTQYVPSVKTISAQQRKLKELWNKGYDGEYDIYLCYKETERYEDPDTGEIKSRKSKDSEWVHAFYEELKSQNDLREEPFRIFFAPETLKNATGDPYAAHIAHALMTSRVMLLMGTQPEYFDTSWVLGERTRFYYYMNEDQFARKIIPVFNHQLMNGKNVTEVIPSEHISIQGIDAAGDLKEAVRSVLSTCEALVTRGESISQYRHAVTERSFREKNKEIAQLMRNADELKQDINGLELKIQRVAAEKEDAVRDSRKNEAEKKEAERELNEALKQKAIAEAKTTEAESKFAEDEKLIKRLLRDMNEDKIRIEDLSGKNRTLKEENDKIADLRNRISQIEAERDTAQAANRELNKKITAFEQAEGTISDLQDQMNRTRTENQNLRANNQALKEKIEMLEAEIKKKPNPVQESDSIPPQKKASYVLKDFGFRQSTGANGARHYGYDLSHSQMDPDSLKKIDEVYASIRSRKDRSITVTVRLEGASGRYREENRIRLDPNKISQASFRLGNLELNEFSGDYILTIDDGKGEIVQEKLTFTAR